jgi:CHAD domain-containing protein
MSRRNAIPAMPRAGDTRNGLARNGHGLHAFLRKSLDQRWRKNRKALQRCRKVFSEEAVHDWRIETRRTLAFLSLLDPCLSKKCLREAEALFARHFKRSARLRDTHVQLAALEGHLERFPELAPFHQALARAETRLARKLRDKIDGKIRSDLKQTVRKLRKWLGKLLRDSNQEPAHWRAILQAVDAAFAAVVERRAHVQPARPATIHAMRIAFKKFRYMVEALHPILPEVAPRQWEEMQACQTWMGEIQDAEVLAAALDRFNEQRRLPLERFREDLRRRQAAAIKRFLSALPKLDHFWPPARPARAQAPLNPTRR